MKRRTLLLTSLCALAVGCSSSSSRRSSSTSVAATTTTTGSTGGVTSTSTGTTTTTTPPPPPPNFQLVSFETVDQGSNSPRGVNVGAHELHLASGADWTTFWPTHSGQLQVPVVDFSQESVLGTFMAQTPGNTNATQVVNVWRDGNSDDVHALVREFRQGVWQTATLRVQTTPFHLVRCATAVSGQGTLTVDRQALLDFEALAAGSNNALGVNNPAYTGGLEVFRDAAAFAAFYAQIQPGVRPPVVDFQREMAVAVLGAYIPRFGNTVETRRLVHDPAANEIRVISRVNPYRGGAAPPPAIEAPFQILRVSAAGGAIRAEVQTPLTLPAATAGLSRAYTGPAETLVVRDAASFAALWAARIGGTPPVVDFSRDQVLFAFEPPASNRTASIARAVQLEDEELVVTVNTLFTSPTRDSRYSMLTTPRTYGPVGFEVVDVTPRP